MADYNSTQLTTINNGERVDIADHGKVFTASFDYTQSGAAAAGSTVGLVKLPAGKIKILGISKLAISAAGAGRTLDVGLEAYVDQDGNTVAADEDLLEDGADVSAAATLDLDQAGPAVEVESAKGVVVAAKIIGGTLPDAATINGVIYFVRA